MMKWVTVPHEYITIVYQSPPDRYIQYMVSHAKLYPGEHCRVCKWMGK